MNKCIVAFILLTGLGEVENDVALSAGHMAIVIGGRSPNTGSGVHTAIRYYYTRILEKTLPVLTLFISHCLVCPFSICVYIESIACGVLKVLSSLQSVISNHIRSITVVHYIP